MENNLFESKSLILTEIDPTEDSKIESQWMHNLDYARLRKKNPVRPFSPAESKKDLNEKLKEADEKGDSFYFAIRRKDKKQNLIGFAFIGMIEWSNGQGELKLLFPNDSFSQNYYKEALNLLLKYIFHELNFHHLNIKIWSYQKKIAEILERTGFKLEACLREFTFRHGDYFDLLVYGMLEQDYIERVENDE